MAAAPLTVLLTRNFAHVHPDHSLELVLERLSRNPGLLPVVSRSEVHHVEGTITPQGIVEFLQKIWDAQEASPTPNGEVR